MPRTAKGKTRFAFRITLVPRDQPAPRRQYVGTQKWKYRAIYNIKMMLSIQVHKASRRARWRWYQFYSVRGYGAPGRLEFVCPYSSMVAKTIFQEEAASVRRYWVECASKCQEILDWLERLPPERYSKELNHYLLRLIIVPYCQREMDEYTASNPYHPPRPWREELGTTNASRLSAGPCLQLLRPTSA